MTKKIKTIQGHIIPIEMVTDAYNVIDRKYQEQKIKICIKGLGPSGNKTIYVHEGPVYLNVGELKKIYKFIFYSNLNIIKPEDIKNLIWGRNGY